MRATLAWSENLLLSAEQTLFRRLAVFVGSCTLEAAEAVCATPQGAEPLGLEVLEGVTALLDQSLVWQRAEEGDAGSEPRFGMLQVVREYVLERLDKSGEAEALRWAHARYYLALVEEVAPQWLRSRAVAWLQRLAQEQENLRAVLGWLRDRGEIELGLQMASALVWSGTTGVY
jgi:predicted ATPase